ncbi:MAG: hypothetical protein LQ352_006801, partial [Teloschistes flavicans]
MASEASASENPSIIRWTLGFLLVGMAWGLTTPFIRRAALDFHPSNHPYLERLAASSPSSSSRHRSDTARSSSSDTAPRAGEGGEGGGRGGGVGEGEIWARLKSLDGAWVAWFVKLKMATAAFGLVDLLRSPR